MTRTRWTALLTVLWLAAGGYGVFAYGLDYYRYRGFPPPRHPPGVTAGQLQTVSFPSAALRTRRAYDVYLPPGYAAARARRQRFGVMYLLHGAPGTARLFVNAGAVGVTMDTLVARHKISPFLIVMPHGGDGSFASDTEWANTPHGRYESFVLDVVRAVDRRFPTVADRGHRVIAGNSEGAYGATMLALRHPTVFGALEAWSGYYHQTPTGVFKHASARTLAAYSPIDLVRRRAPQLKRLPLRAYLYAGRSDPDLAQQAPFAAALRATGARVTTATPPGRHDWRLWRHLTPRMLRWAARAMGARP